MDNFIQNQFAFIQKKNKNHLFLVLAFVASSILISCKPKSNPSPPAPTATFSTLNEKEAICEADLRKKMESKLLALAAPNNISKNEQDFLALLADGNSFRASDSIAEYNLNKNEYNAITSVGVDHRSKNKKRSLSIVYSLSRSDKDTNGSFILNIEYTHSRPSIEIDAVGQTFLVSEDCDLTLTETKMSTRSKINDSQFDQTETIFYIDGGKGISQKSFEKPSNVSIENIETIKDVINLPSDSFLFLEGEGFVQVENIAENPVVKNVFGVDLSFESLTTVIKKNSAPLLHIQILANQKEGLYKASYEEIPNYENWILPKSIWDNQLLASTSYSLSLVKSDLPENYFSNNNSVKLLSSKRPDYKNFDAYWKVSNESLGTEEYSYSAVLTENSLSNTNIGARLLPEDSLGNNTIQTDLPEIVNIADEILQKEPTSRSDQIKLILKYLSKNYVYDFDMIKNNVVRSLTTSEALEKGKGVCQHYAVIFTSIARALNIPTRIIYGYLLTGDEPGAHAWVEAEVRPGVWQVIEPQSENGLTSTYTRYYFPISRATFLEDKDSNSFSSTINLFKTKFKLLPNN